MCEECERSAAGRPGEAGKRYEVRDWVVGMVHHPEDSGSCT